MVCPSTASRRNESTDRSDAAALDAAHVLNLPNLANVFNRIPKLMSVQVLSADGADVRDANARVTRSEQLRAGSDTVSIDVDLPRRIFDTVASDQIFDGVRARLVSQDLRVRLAGGTQGPPVSASGFTPNEIARIQRAFATSARKVSLYIIDSGWPDQDARQQSVDAIMSLLNEMRIRWRLGFPEQLPLLPIWTETYDHCKKVRNSIAPVDALDTQDVVQTVYVPLSKAQGGDLVLRQILIVDYMMRTLGPQLGNVDAPLISSRKPANGRTMN